MVAAVSPVAYGLNVVNGLGTCAWAREAARARPGRWTQPVAWAVGLAVVVDGLGYAIALVVAGNWSAKTSDRQPTSQPPTPPLSLDAR